MRKNTLATYAIMLFLIPTFVLLGVIVFREKYYAWISLCVAIFSCVPLFIVFERRENTSTEITILAVLIAVSVIGRFVFAWLPAFKPITALTVIVGMYLGKEAGFVVGSLSAVVSNFYFGQGPWTPFQMFVWGVIGFFAGLVSKPLRKSRILICIYGLIAGVIYSLCMDVWTTIWADGTLNLTRYLASVAVSVPSMIIYSASNVVFLFLLNKPFGDKLSRIKKKFGLFITKG